MNTGQQVALEIIEGYLGEREIDGPRGNPIIQRIIDKVMSEVDNNHHDDSSIAWCAIFMSYFFMRCGVVDKPIIAARKWNKVGTKVDDPQFGDIVIYWRYSVNDWRGHVGIYLRRVGDQIYTLGGNQSDAVTVTPYAASRLLEYRRID